MPKAYLPNDLPEIVATKGDNVAFVRDFKGKEITIKGSLYQIHKGNNGKTIFFVVESQPEPKLNSFLSTCPVGIQESKQYDIAKVQ